MSHSSETFEMQASTGSPEDTNEDDQDDQVWKDVKAETGYSSYKKYIETLVYSEQRFGKLLSYLSTYHRWDHPGEIVVLDIHKDGTKVISLNAGHSSHGFQSETAHKMSTRLLQNLRSPPEDIPIRIVLWSIPRDFYPHTRIIQALGLGLDMDPSFFESLIHMNLSTDKRSWRWLPARVISQVIIGDSIATIAQDYRRERHAPPVLVIAGFFNLKLGFIDDDELDKPYYRIFNEIMNREISGGTSLFRSAIDRVTSNDPGSVPSNYYLKLLSKYVHKDCYVDTEVDTILLIAVLPLLRLEIFRLRGQLSTIESVLRQVQFDVEYPRLSSEELKAKRYNTLDKHRFWLRRRLEGLQESRDTFQKFARSHNAANWLETKIWLSQDADIQEVVAMARTKELEVRDYMQLQIGNLSISESRKSIQLSNQQMHEAKRGKRSI